MAGRPGRSGRKRKPSAIKRLEGNRGKRRLTDDVRGLGVPQCPTYLSAAHRLLWRDTLSALPAGVLTKADTAVLESWVIAWECLRSTTVLLIRTGWLVQSPQGSIRNPLVAIRRGAQAELRSLASELGLTPAGRAKLIATQEDEDDPMTLLLGLDDDMTEDWSVAKH